jgi:hypothetical protein
MYEDFYLLGYNTVVNQQKFRRNISTFARSKQSCACYLADGVDMFLRIIVWLPTEDTALHPRRSQAFFAFVAGLKS